MLGSGRLLLLVSCFVAGALVQRESDTVRSLQLAAGAPTGLSVRGSLEEVRGSLARLSLALDTRPVRRMSSVLDLTVADVTAAVVPAGWRAERSVIRVDGRGPDL